MQTSNCSYLPASARQLQCISSTVCIPWWLGRSAARKSWKSKRMAGRHSSLREWKQHPREIRASVFKAKYRQTFVITFFFFFYVMLCVVNTTFAIKKKKKLIFQHYTWISFKWYDNLFVFIIHAIVIIRFFKDIFFFLLYCF